MDWTNFTNSPLLLQPPPLYNNARESTFQVNVFFLYPPEFISQPKVFLFSVYAERELGLEWVNNLWKVKIEILVFQ